MNTEEIGGPAGPKVTRLLYFVGAGLICTFAVNKWRDFQRNSTVIKQQQQQHEHHQLPENSANFLK